MAGETNAAHHLGREQTVEALGKTWTLGRWTRAVWWRVLEWARGQVPDPLDAVEATLERMATRQAKLLTEANAKETSPADGPRLREEAMVLERRGEQLLRAALDKRMVYLSVTSPEVQALTDSFEGSLKVIGELLREHHPKEAEGGEVDYAVLQAVTAKEGGLKALFDTALGRAPAAPQGNG